jgi:serine protease AprX
MTHRLLLFGLTAGLATAMFAQTSNLSPDLQAMMTPQQTGAINQAAANAGASAGTTAVSAGAGSVINVIIQFAQTPTSVQNQMVQNAGGGLIEPLGSSNAAVYSVPVSGLSTIAANSSVVYISPDRSVRPFLDLTDAAVNANIALQYGYNGNGIGIALIDSGVAQHPDLSPRVVHREDFTSENSGEDAYGHGTHVAGILASDGADSSGSQYTRTFRGIAPAAKIVSLRVLDANGNGTDSAVVLAIYRAIALKNT